MVINKRRDYYRENIKFLLQFQKPFLVKGTYEIPDTPEEAYFCRFKNIYPVIYGAEAKLLCDHIHIERRACTKYYGRFTIDDIGRTFLICVIPYIYEENRGGLKLYERISTYIRPIAPAGWYQSEHQLFSQIPYKHLLDFRYLPTGKYRYLSTISSYVRVGIQMQKPRKKKCLSKDKNTPLTSAQQRERYVLHIVQQIEELSRTKTGRKILLQHRGCLVNNQDKPAYLTWLLSMLLNYHVPPKAGKRILSCSSIRPAYFEKMTGHSPDAWCQKYLPAADVPIPSTKSCTQQEILLLPPP